MFVEENRGLHLGLVGVLLLALAFTASSCSETVPLATVETQGTAPLTEDLLKNATYHLDSGNDSEFQLVDGNCEVQYGEGATQKDSVELSHTAFGDMDKDGDGDGVAVLWYQSGGSGTFVFLVAMDNIEGQPQQVAATLLGDRVQVQNITIEDGTIIVDEIIHGPDDPMCCPSLEVQRTYRIEGAMLTQMPTETFAGDVSETQTITFVPEIPEEIREGSCWTSSIATLGRPGTWRCSVENGIYDPCFELEEGTVVCDANPVTGAAGFQLSLTEPLPEAESGNLDAGAWLVELADGTFCNRATGAMGIVNGKPTTFYCTSEDPDESGCILGELQSGTPWMAEKAVLSTTTHEIIGAGTTMMAIRTLYK